MVGATHGAIKCGLELLHLWNLWSCRDNGTEFDLEFKKDDKWKWALRNVSYR